MRFKALRVLIRAGGLELEIIRHALHWSKKVVLGHGRTEVGN